MIGDLAQPNLKNIKPAKIPSMPPIPDLKLKGPASPTPIKPQNMSGGNKMKPMKLAYTVGIKKAEEEHDHFVPMPLSSGSTIMIHSSVFPKFLDLIDSNYDAKKLQEFTQNHLGSKIHIIQGDVSKFKPQDFLLGHDKLNKEKTAAPLPFNTLSRLQSGMRQGSLTPVRQIAMGEKVNRMAKSVNRQNLIQRAETPVIARDPRLRPAAGPSVGTRVERIRTGPEASSSPRSGINQRPMIQSSPDQLMNANASTMRARLMSPERQQLMQRPAIQSTDMGPGRMDTPHPDKIMVSEIGNPTASQFTRSHMLGPTMMSSPQMNPSQIRQGLMSPAGMYMRGQSNLQATRAG